MQEIRDDVRRIGQEQQPDRCPEKQPQFALVQFPCRRPNPRNEKRNGGQKKVEDQESVEYLLRKDDAERHQHKAEKSEQAKALLFLFAEGLGNYHIKSTLYYKVKR